MSWPLDIVIASPGLPHDGTTIATKSLGGSETAALMVASHLATRGHHVTLFSPGHQGSVMDGVVYLPLEQFPAYATSSPHDICIISRQIEFLRLPLQAKIRILYCHDLALKRQRNLAGGVLWSVDALYVLSQFMKRQYQEVYEGLPDETFFVTRNGVDLRSFAGLERVPRDRHTVVYGSRPERGLEQCLAIMERLAQQGSPIRLKVAAYDNQAPQLAQYYQALCTRAQSLPNVTLLGALTQQQWHRELAGARALLYPGCPGDFREVSCIVALEALAAGTPVIGCRQGALPESVPPQCGVLLAEEDTHVQSPEYLDQFTSVVAQMCADDALFRSCSFAGRERAALLDWGDVAAEWEADWMRRFAERTNDPWRVERWYERIGERDALSA